MSRRFFVEPGTIDDDAVSLDGALARRLSSVMRLRAGDTAVLFDGSGREAEVRLESVSSKSAAGVVIRRFESAPEPGVRLFLYQSITKGERFEWLLEKGTEIGVHAFVPLVTARAVVRTAAQAQKYDRWRRIIVEAAEQSGRGRLPALDAPQPLDAALASAPGVLLLPFEDAGETAPSIASALHGEIDALFALGEVSVFIGPEGGFTPEEVAAARDAGATIVTMGHRVLRSETAGLVAATLVLQHAGDLG